MVSSREKLRLKLYAKRSCGDCRACCTTERVTDLGKEPGVACEHLQEGGAGGCSRYEARPDGCRQWACVWRSGSNLLGEAERPDKIGAVLDSDAHGILYAKATGPNGFERAGQVLARLAQKRVVVLTSSDGREGIAFGPSEMVARYKKGVDDAAE